MTNDWGRFAVKNKNLRERKEERDRIGHSVRRCRDVERLRGFRLREFFLRVLTGGTLHFFPARRSETRGGEKRAGIKQSRIRRGFYSNFLRPVSTICALLIPFSTSRLIRRKKSRAKICGITWPRVVLPLPDHFLRMFEAFLGKRCSKVADLCVMEDSRRDARSQTWEKKIMKGTHAFFKFHFFRFCLQLKYAFSL